MNAERFLEVTADSPWGRKAAKTGYRGFFDGIDRFDPETIDEGTSQQFESLVQTAEEYGIDLAACEVTGARCDLCDARERAERKANPSEEDWLLMGVEYAEVTVYFEYDGSIYYLFMKCMEIDGVWLIADDVRLRPREGP